MRLRALKGEPDEPPIKAFAPPPPGTTMGRRKSRKDNYTDNIGNSSDPLIYEPTASEEETDSHLRGGVLRPAELKTLASNTKDITEFRALGSGVLSPPETISSPSDSKLTPSESSHLARLAAQIETARSRKALLDDREVFLNLVKARAKSALEELKRKGEKPASICGFDTRLTWTEEEFSAWRASPEGQETFTTKQLVNPSTETDNEAPSEHEVNGVKDDSVNGGVGKAEGQSEGMCTKRRCGRHQAWQKLQSQEVAFEREQLRQEMKRLIAEEKGVKERAAIRGLEEE